MEMHRHHVVPKHAGGTDDPDNIVLLTREEHAAAHLARYHEVGDVRDLCAYHMLQGAMEEFRADYGRLGGLSVQARRKAQGLTSYGLEPGSERQRACAALGGEVQGARNAASGHMLTIRKMVNEPVRVQRAVEACRSKKVNAFFDPVVHQRVAIKGGQVQGKRNAETGHLASISSVYWQDVKSGAKIREKRIWITNGQIVKMVLASIPIPPGWTQGRRTNDS